MIDDGAKRDGGGQRASARTPEESRSHQHVAQVIARILAKRQASTKKETPYRAANLPDPESDSNHD